MRDVESPPASMAASMARPGATLSQRLLPSLTIGPRTLRVVPVPAGAPALGPAMVAPENFR